MLQQVTGIAPFERWEREEKIREIRKVKREKRRKEKEEEDSKKRMQAERDETEVVNPTATLVSKNIAESSNLISSFASNFVASLPSLNHFVAPLVHPLDDSDTSSLIAPLTSSTPSAQPPASSTPSEHSSVINSTSITEQQNASVTLSTTNHSVPATPANQTSTPPPPSSSPPSSSSIHLHLHDGLSLHRLLDEHEYENEAIRQSIEIINETNKRWAKEKERKRKEGEEASEKMEASVWWSVAGVFVAAILKFSGWAEWNNY